MSDRTVLVIEDNEHNRYLVRFILEQSGYTVTEATNGSEGIAAATNNPPRLILLDIQLPEMDGYEVARRLRADSRFDAVAIVAVTSYAMIGDRERILAAGCDGYIEKPIDPDHFMEQIEGFLAGHSGRD